MPLEETPTSALLDGRYELGACVGQGAMARVYRAEDVLLGRTVAVKMMRTDADALSNPARARTEMALLASLNHPSLVTLFDACIVPGRPEYLVMEFVEGASLAEELQSGPLAADEVAALAAELAIALHVVHTAGVVHRDVKPSNVLLAPDPLPTRRHRAKLADFGIALLADSARLTSPGLVVGTAAYLAPEQVRGEPSAAPVDIYALGLLLLESLTGERAFAGSSGIGAVMARLVEAPAVPEWLGPQWSALLRAMTASDPSIRPTALDVLHSVADLPTDIRRPPVDAGSPAAPTPTVPLSAAVATRAMVPVAPTSGEDPRTSRRARRQRSRRRRTLVGSAAAGVAVLGVGAALWVGTVTSGAPDTEVATPSPSATVVAEEDVTPADEVAVPAGAVVDEGTSPAQQATDKAAKAAQQAADKAARDADKAVRDADKTSRGKASGD